MIRDVRLLLQRRKLLFLHLIYEQQIKRSHQHKEKEACITEDAL